MEGKDKGNDWEVVSLTASTYAAAPGPQTPTPLAAATADSKLDASYTAKQYEFQSPSSMFMSGHFLLPKDKEMDTSTCGYASSQEKEDNKSKEDDELQTSLSMSSEFEPVNGGFTGGEIESSEDEERKREEEVEEEVVNEGWWKKRALSVYKNVKEATTLWSVFWAAAMVGIAIVGQRWQKEKMHVQQLKLQFRIDNERLSCLVVPFKGTQSFG